MLTNQELVLNAVSIMCLYIFLYFVTYTSLKYKNQGFRNLDSDRRLYIVKNYVKSFVLAACSYRAILQAYAVLFDNDSLDDTSTQINTLAYFLTDTVGLLLVRGLQFNTKLHHVVTNILGIYVITSTFKPVCQQYLPVLYASFSSLAFLVNFYLAYRSHTDTPKVRYYLSKFSFWIYLLTSVVNWMVQIWYMNVLLSNEIYLFPFFYSFCLAVIIYDDIVLMKWLKQDFNKRTLNAEIKKEVNMTAVDELTTTKCD